MKELIKKLFFKFRQIISFCFVGCVNTLVDFLCFTVASAVLGLAPWLSQAVGYSCGIVCSFVLNRSLTFRDGTRKLRQQILLFLLVNVAALVLSSLFIQLLSESGTNLYLAKILDTGLFTVINFFAYKYIVFRDRGKS